MRFWKLLLCLKEFQCWWLIMMSWICKDGKSLNEYATKISYPIQTKPNAFSSLVLISNKFICKNTWRLQMCSKGPHSCHLSHFLNLLVQLSLLEALPVLLLCTLPEPVTPTANYLCSVQHSQELNMRLEFSTPWNEPVAGAMTKSLIW